MRKAVIAVRALSVVLAIIVLGLALSCGGGHRTASVLPGVSGDTHSTAGGGSDRSASVPLSEISKLDPRLQELYADPGWEGPVTPAPPVEGAPAPPELTIERILSENAAIERLDRNVEPVVDSKGVSYPFVPPADPNYFPMAGEYAANIYPGSPPLANPPWGSDAAADGDRLEDRLQRVDQFNKIPRSFVWRGETITNQFNRGFAGDSTLAAVYQSYRDVDGRWGEWSYPASQTYVTVPEPGIDVYGNVFDKLQQASKVKRFSQVENFAWYDILIAPLDVRGPSVMSPQPPNETYAAVQEFYFDAERSVAGAEAWMVALTSSEEDKIQELIDKQINEGPVATFPVFGTIFKRWADDVYNVGVDEPWTGRLGWPLGDPFIDRSGRYLTGPSGQYLRYGQYFEKGYMWWNDYVLPTIPDEVYIYMYDKACTLITGGTYTQDPVVVKYGTGGPLGVNVFVNPLVANIGDPIYYKAFPYGGPTTNVNGFADDWCLWNFRDGTVSAASEFYPIHQYFVEAKYTARVMFTLDADGDGNPDGNTVGYKVFANAPEINIGHLGAGGGGGGGGNPVLVVEDTGGTTNANAIKTDLTALGVSYDSKTRSEVAGAATLQPYLLVIWCAPASSSQIDTTEQTFLRTYVQTNHGNLFIPYQYLYSCYDSSFYQMMGHTTSFWTWFQSYWVTSGSDYYGNGYILGTGPGGSISQLNSTYVSPCTEAYYYYYNGGSATKTMCGEYGYTPYYVEGLLRDNYTAGDGGMACWVGANWDAFTGTTPATPGRKGALQNLIQYIDPEIFTAGGGGGGGEAIDPYDGPVDIADVFAYVYAKDGSEIAGGDGDTVGTRAAVSVTTGSGPQTIFYDAMARCKAATNLIYQWEFTPSGGYGTWTKYTSYAYTGGIDPDGTGPLLEGDPFPVNCRVYNSSYGSYAAAPVTERDSDSVLVSVSGPKPVDIMDNGTVIASGYVKDPVTGNVTLDLNYKIAFGDPSYDSIWIDYDYNFVTFQNRVQHTPHALVDGSYTYSLTIPTPSYRSYYIAIRVYDASAPNAMDTYVWASPVKVVSPVLLINDDCSSAAITALKDDLTAIGSGYTEKASSAVTAADFSGTQLVIWHGKDNGTSYSPSRITSALKTLFKNYWDAGGDAITIIPYEYYYYIGGSYDNTWLNNYWDLNGNSYPYAYLFTYYSYYYYYYDNCYTYNGVGSGPGGTVSNVYYGKSTYPQHMSYAYNGYGRIPSTRTLMSAGQYATYYLRSWYYDTIGATGGGRNVVYGASWNDTNSSSMSGTGGRSGLLRNLIEVANPDLM